MFRNLLNGKRYGDGQKLLPHLQKQILKFVELSQKKEGIVRFDPPSHHGSTGPINTAQVTRSAPGDSVSDALGDGDWFVTNAAHHPCGVRADFPSDLHLGVRRSSDHHVAERRF